MNIDARTKDYVAKRTEEGKSKREIMRCLKRYVAREVYRQITHPVPAPSVLDLRPLRHELGMTLQQAATELGTWPSTISRLERGKMRDDELLNRYRSWLGSQQPTSMICSAGPLISINSTMITDQTSPALGTVR